MATATKMAKGAGGDGEAPPAPRLDGLPAGSVPTKAPFFYHWADRPHWEALATDPSGRLWVCRWQPARRAWGPWRKN